MTLTKDDEQLCFDITCFLENDGQNFDTLALRLFERQYRCIPAYQRFCDAKGKSPDTVVDWKDVPHAPMVVFKRFDISCSALEETKVVFHSSGTTRWFHSKHYMDEYAIELYKLSLSKGFEHFVNKNNNLPIWSLVPPANQAPNSSLAFMVQHLIDNSHKKCEQLWDDGLNTAKLSLIDKPIILFGTALSFLQIFGKINNIKLPSGSIIVETGGFKGKNVEITREELYKMFSTHLSVPSKKIISEYGMCEMVSQFYDSNGLKTSMPWCRTRVLDPITHKEVNLGEKGVLAHFDLANFNSISAILTEDEAIRKENGFILLGRLKGSELRGCSLMAEELLEKFGRKNQS